MNTKQTPKPYRPTEEEKSAVLDLKNFYDWLQIQHRCEDQEIEELTAAQLKKQRAAVRNAYKGALMIQKALKDFTWG